MTKSQNVRRRLGFTLLEIMTSVTLALMLMYAVARIFSRVGGAMNETSSAMEMTNALRNAKNRLTLDLESLSTTPAPPRNSRNGEGYLCYVEGLGGPFTRVAQSGPFAVGDIALDTERSQANPKSEDCYDYCDNTIGDLDDILSFTAKAPDGQPFRGRYIEPIYDGNANIIGGTESTFESQYAEIIWFVRGTTLYRRVLPIIPDKTLQDSFKALRCASRPEGNFPGVAYKNVMQGFGFFRFYDASVHIGSDGCLVANTLGDLTNRANRYFYWNPCGLQLHPDDSSSVPSYAMNIHGSSGAWYWLRMATLQESAAPNFRAGAPFGENEKARDFNPNDINAYTARRIWGCDLRGYSFGPGFVTNYWNGEAQALSLQSEDGDTRLSESRIYECSELPLSSVNDVRYPFIDFWNAPNPWNEVNYETGDLSLTQSDYIDNNNVDADLALNQDVILTNVISFNVKAWDPNVSAYVDLGSGVPNNYKLDDSYNPYNPNDLGSYGYYGVNKQGLELPCVYDTWTEQYQRELYIYEDYCANNSVTPLTKSNGGSLADIESEGTISASQLKDYPPPYDVRLKSLQIEIRVFDPRSKNIRNATFDVDLSSL